MNIEELEREIEILQKRVNILERKENRRASYKYIRIIFKMVVYALIIFALWRGYDYVVNGIPKMLNDKIQEINPFKKK